jgi:hypothetical protein
MFFRHNTEEKEAKTFSARPFEKLKACLLFSPPQKKTKLVLAIIGGRQVKKKFVPFVGDFWITRDEKSLSTFYMISYRKTIHIRSLSLS